MEWEKNGEANKNMKFYGDKVASSFEYNWKLRLNLDEHSFQVLKSDKKKEQYIYTYTQHQHVV